MRRFVLQLGNCVAALCVMGSGGRTLAQGTWAQYAGGPDRTSTLTASEFDPSSLASPAWIAQRDSQNRVISFVAQQCPMVSRTHVFAVGSVQSGTSRLWRLYSLNRRTGVVAWEAPVAAPVTDSWSSVGLDLRQNRVIGVSGREVSCFDMMTGGLVWRTTLPLSIINASPCVTVDRTLTNRVFITDSDGANGGGHLYCINIDQFVPTINPHQLGEIVWTADLAGTSGNTPAYRDGRVYASSAGNYDWQIPGAVQAFNAEDGSQIWRTENVIGQGYYGGVGIVEEYEKLYVLVSSYSFFGNSVSANTEKLDAMSGQLMWDTESNRSAAIPVELSPSNVMVSGGIQGFGTAPTLQLITAKGYATTNWSSLGISRMGGWSTQPIFDAKAGRIFSGELPINAGGFGAGIRMHVIDAEQLVSGVLDEQVYEGFGSSPAIAGKNLYCLGPTGLFAFGPTPINADVNNDGMIGVEDIYEFCWSGGFDVDGNGSVDSADFELLNTLVRAEDERRYTKGGRTQ